MERRRRCGLFAWCIAGLLAGALIVGAGACKEAGRGAAQIDEELTAAYKELLEADPYARMDTLAPRFKEMMLHDLASPAAFAGPLTKLAEQISIIASRDGKVKFYSWDEMTGGTWHNIAAVAQYRTDNEKVGILLISTGDETETGAWTDSEIRDVYDIDSGGVVHYLTFGLGTHGSGMQHEIIQIFRFDGAELVRCPDCLDGAADVTIEYPRMDSAELEFDPAANEISYNGFAWNEEEGIYEATGKRVVMKLVDGKFVTQK